MLLSYTKYILELVPGSFFRFLLNFYFFKVMHVFYQSQRFLHGFQQKGVDPCISSIFHQFPLSEVNDLKSFYLFVLIFIHLFKNNMLNCFSLEFLDFRYLLLLSYYFFLFFSLLLPLNLSHTWCLPYCNFVCIIKTEPNVILLQFSPHKPGFIFF